MWQASPPARYEGNPTGAGDAVVASVLSGFAEGLEWPQRLTRAAALSAAAVLAPAAGEFDAARIKPIGRRGPAPASTRSHQANHYIGTTVNR
jgi:tagatose 6-phosphate kinase